MGNRSNKNPRKAHFSGTRLIKTKIIYLACLSNAIKYTDIRYVSAAAISSSEWLPSLERKMPEIWKVSNIKSSSNKRLL